MVQGIKKLSGKPSKAKTANSHKATQMKAEKVRVKLGNPRQLPTKHFRADAVEERTLSKAIDKANEQKVAAKLIQGGDRLRTTDLMQRGKALNKEIRRGIVKKKLGRVEEKLKTLKEKAVKEGLD